MKKATTCVDGKKHNYKQAQTGYHYYEHLKVIEVEKEYQDYNAPKDANGKYPIKKKMEQKTVDETPGKHYSMFVCSSCGDQIERVVKDHGPNFAKWQGNTRSNM